MFFEDVDGEGDLDIVTYDCSKVAVYTRNGSGGWSKAASFVIPSSRESNAFRVSGDAAQKGYSDIELINSEGGMFSSRNYIRFSSRFRRLNHCQSDWFPRVQTNPGAVALLPS
jgi:hypothetical protein